MSTSSHTARVASRAFATTSRCPIGFGLRSEPSKPQPQKETPKPQLRNEPPNPQLRNEPPKPQLRNEPPKPQPRQERLPSGDRERPPHVGLPDRDEPRQGSGGRSFNGRNSSSSEFRRRAPERSSQVGAGDLAFGLERPLRTSEVFGQLSHGERIQTPGWSERKDWRFPPAEKQKLKELSKLRKAGLLVTRPREKKWIPDEMVPVSIEIKDRERVKIPFESGSGALSNEGMEFLDRDPEAERGSLNTGMMLDWRETQLGEPIPDLEIGRIVETRRSNSLSLGMILAHVVVGGRNRMLLLQTSGEIWPISTHDVQFVMPKSLVPAELAEQCWSPSLLEYWANGIEIPSGNEESAGEFAGMLAARRKAVAMLRKVVRETEKMHQRMLAATPGKGQRAGMEAAWEQFAPADEETRGVTTALQVAEYMLNVDKPETPVEVQPSTLPAFAAHQLMMRRPDLFLADEADMWNTGAFMVRSRAERQCVADMTKLVGQFAPEVAEFVDRARKAIQFSRNIKASPSGKLEEVKQDLPAWTETDRNIISVLLLSLYETRSTQPSVWMPLATNIVKALEAYPEEDIERGTFAKVLEEIGVRAPWDTLKGSEAQEDVIRSLALSGQTPPAQGELFKGNELDDLRHDFSSHRVYVIDEGSAGELDDGLAVERVANSTDCWIHVHIADPTRLIPRDHPLAFRASFQGSTVYLPEGRLPLLPLDMIMSEMSLGAKREKHSTVVFSARIGENGEIKDSDVRLGWATQPRVITYDIVDGVLGAKVERLRPFGKPVEVEHDGQKSSAVSPEDEKDLQLLQQVAMRFRLNRMKTAGLDWCIHEPSIRIVSQLPETGKNLYDSKNIPSSPQLFNGFPLVDFTSSVYVPGTSVAALDSRAVISECAVVANRVAAQFCHTNDIPVMYRGQAAPKEVRMAGSASSSLESVLAKRNAFGQIDPLELARHPFGWGPVQLSPTPIEHWALGFEASGPGYLRATSPLRRFEDMLVHWQIKSFLARAKGLPSASSLAPQLSASEVETLSKRSAAAERRVGNLSRTAAAMWRAKLALSRLNGPDVPGYQAIQGETVDLRLPLTAHVAAHPSFHTSGQHAKTTLWVPSLGFAVDLAGEYQGWNIGDVVSVIVSEGSVHPNPVLSCILVT